MNNIPRCCSQPSLNMINAMQLIIAMEDAPAKTRQGMNRLFEDAQTSPLKLAGVQAG